MIRAERAGNFILINIDATINGTDLVEINSKAQSLLFKNEKIISMNVVEYKHTGTENEIVLGYKARKIILLIG